MGGRVFDPHRARRPWVYRVDGTEHAPRHMAGEQDVVRDQSQSLGTRYGGAFVEHRVRVQDHHRLDWYRLEGSDHC